MLMFLLNKVIGMLMLPPCIFIIILDIVVVYMYIKRLQGRYLITCCTILLYLLSIPVIARILLSPLENAYTPVFNKAEAVIALGGGAVPDTVGVNGSGTLRAYSANRLLTAVQLSIKYDIPIIVSGGQVFSDSGNEGDIARKILHNLDFNNNKVIIENQSRNTYENAVNTLNICKNLKINNVYLVTSSWHMPRSIANFNKVYVNSGIKIIPYPCDYLLSPKNKFNILDLVPQMWALEASYLALHEYLGMLAFKIL